MTRLKLFRLSLLARPFRFLRHHDSGPNCIALFIASFGVAGLYLNFEATPVGADPDAVLARQAAAPSAPPLPMPASISKSLEAAGGVQRVAEEGVVRGTMAIQFNRLLLEKAAAQLKDVPSYSATFFKQERIKGDLSEGQVIELKMRHKPLGVYMKWLTGNKGQQALYVDGRHGGKMLVQLGGWKSRLPSLKLDPSGTLAMSEARYPITKAGILGIVNESLAVRKADLKFNEEVDYEIRSDQVFDKRECYLITVTYTAPKYHETYRKCLTYIDRETALPVCIRNFTWAEQVDDADPENLDETTLVEYYTFTNINLKSKLTDVAFDRNNKEYAFR